MNRKKVDINVVLDLKARGFKQQDIAKQIGVRDSTISMAIKAHENKIKNQQKNAEERAKALELLNINDQDLKSIEKKITSESANFFEEFPIDSIRQNVMIKGQQFTIVRKRPEKMNISDREKQLEAIIDLYDHFLTDCLLPLQKTHPDVFKLITDYVDKFGGLIQEYNYDPQVSTSEEDDIIPPDPNNEKIIVIDQARMIKNV